VNRLLLALILLLPACAGGPAPATVLDTGGPPVAAGTPPSPTEPSDPPPEQERPLPPSILVDASVTRKGPEGGPPVTVNVRGGEPVPWTSAELSFAPPPFDPTAVVAAPRFVSVWKTSEYEPGTVRVCSDLRGMPADALFLELVPAASEVVWADGTRGTFRGIHSQGQRPIEWELDILTTVPPEDPDIRSLTVALDLHRATRVRRHEASVGVGQAAAIHFGVCTKRWILPEDLQVTEFEVTRYGDPILPLFDRGLRTDRLVRLADASGEVLQDRGGGGAGSVRTRDWGFWPEREMKAPLRVTVDLPLDTVTTRILLRMKDVRPGD
jgi:hypothetical protein